MQFSFNTKTTRFALLTSMFALLTACGNSAINSVKNEYIDHQKTTTVSQLLDNRNICKEINWKSFNDEKERKIVEYQCVFKDSADYLSEKRKEFVNQTVGSYNSTRKQLEDELEATKNDLSNDYPNSTQAIKKLQERQVALTQSPPIVTERLTRLENLSATLSDLIQNYEDNKMIKILSSRDFGELEIRELGIDRRAGNLNSLQMQLQYLSSQRPDRYNEYKRANVDPYLRLYQSRLRDISALNQRTIESEKQNIQRNHQAEIEHLQQDIETEQHRKDERKKTDSAKIDLLKNELAKLGGELDVAAVESQALSKYPKYEYVVETFQWIINKEDNPTLAYGELSAVIKDKHTSISKYSRPSQIFEVIAKTDAKDYRTYMQQAGSFSFFKMLGY